MTVGNSMKQKRINYYDVVVYELFTTYKKALCAGCRGLLDLKGEGVERVIVERITDLPEGRRDRYENLRLVHFCCRRKSMRNDQAARAKQFSEQGKSPREIAITLGLSLATIYTYLKKANRPQPPVFPHLKPHLFHPV